LFLLLAHQPTVSGGLCGLGTYVGNPNGNDPKAMAQFESQFDNFTHYMGMAPTFMNSFVDFTQNWTGWVSNAQWSSWSWSLSSRSKNIIPVIGVPMLPGYWTAGYEEDMLNEIVKGTYDDVFKGIIQAYANQSYTTIHARIGWEADGNWYTWSWNGNISSGYIYPLWVKAWRHIATVLHSIPGVKVYTTWNPAAINWVPFPLELVYPGDDVVDVIGLDLYSPLYPEDLYDWALNNGKMDANISVWAANPINRIHFWDYPNANQWSHNSTGGWGMLAHLALAEQHKKPIAFCESGVGVSPSYPNNGIRDDGVFPTYLAKAISASGLECLYINIWDVNVGDGLWQFTDGTKPAAAAAWKAAFGA